MQLFGKVCSAINCIHMYSHVYIFAGIIGARFSYGWLEKFTKRHPRISKRKSTAKKVTRLRNAKEKLQVWGQLLDKANSLGYLSNPAGVYNFDESPFKLGELFHVVLAEKGCKTVPIYSSASDREQITVLVGGSADGRMCRPLILFSGTCHVESRIIGSYDECWFAVNKSGTMDPEIWNSYMQQEVIPSMQADQVTFKIGLQQYNLDRNLLQNIIIFDGYYAHTNGGFVKLAEDSEKDIILVKLPSGLTDILQPLDTAVFGPFKKAWRDYLRDNRLTYEFEVQFARPYMRF